VLSDDNLEVLAFLAEQRLARPEQVAQLIGTSEAAAARRLRRLAEAGYVERAQPFRDDPPHSWITRKGLRVIESRLPAPDGTELGNYRHDVGMGWVWLAARDGAFGRARAVRSERTMRSADGRAAEGEERFGLRIAGEGRRGGSLTHYADMLIDTESGRRIAVELELTQKSPGRLEKIMRRYVADRRIDAVVYLVDDPRVARGVLAAAARAGATDLVHVQPVRWATPTGAGRRRAPAQRQRAQARRAAEVTR